VAQWVILPLYTQDIKGSNPNMEAGKYEDIPGFSLSLQENSSTVSQTGSRILFAYPFQCIIG
jgi:hypothetical protein